MKIAIFGRITDNTDISVLVQFFAYLATREIEYTLYHPYAEDLKRRLPDPSIIDTSKVFHTKQSDG